MSKTYLVTGGAGFIGSNFIKYMFRKYDDKINIINMDALTYAGNLENLKDIEDRPNYKFFKGDIVEKEDVKRVFSENDIDIVIHFAAESHVDRSIKNPDIFIKTNVLGTNNLLNASREAWSTGDDTYAEGKRFVHVSTDEVYGSLDFGDTYFYEDTPINTSSPYSSSKASSDLFVLANYHTYKLPVVVTRCSNNYGPYQFPEKLIPLVINNALKGKELPVYGDGRNIRDWLYVDDHSNAIDVAAEKGRCGEVYNVGGHNEVANIDIVKTIIDTIRELLPEDDDRRSNATYDLIRFVADRKGHDLRYAIAPDKISKELGWRPETKFKDGIVKTVKWYLDNQDWMAHVTSGEYAQYYESMYS